MSLEGILRKESRKRFKNQLRCKRVNLNWPIHAQRVVDVFREIQAEGDKHGVALFVTEPEWFNPAYDDFGLRKGEFPLGETAVILSFMTRRTGTGVLVRTEEGTQTTFDSEKGAELVVHHSPSQGVVQVFFAPPKIEKSIESDAILYTHTYNTDDVTRDWVMDLVPSFFTFNRVESLLERPSLLDRLRVRWWRFIDIRNRHGYLEKLQHVLTPWELLLIAGTAAPLIWLVNWLWKVLNPLIL